MSEMLPAAVSPTLRLTAWSMIALVAAIVAGSAVATTEIVARGQGKVIAASRTQSIQPQADGRIVGIPVAEGQRVAAGELLVEMDPTAAAADIERLAAEIERQALEAANATAQVEALTRADPADGAFVGLGRSAMRRGMSGSGPRAAEAEARLAAELTALEDQISQLDAETTRIARSQDAQQARLDRSRVDRDIAGRRFRSAEALRKGGTISEADFLDRLRETKAADADVAIAERELASLAAAAEALLRQRAGVVSAAIAAHRKQASDAGIALAGLKAELGAAERRLADLSIRAPIAGKVEDLRVFIRGRDHAAPPRADRTPQARNSRGQDRALPLRIWSGRRVSISGFQHLAGRCSDPSRVAVQTMAQGKTFYQEGKICRSESDRRGTSGEDLYQAAAQTVLPCRCPQFRCLRAPRCRSLQIEKNGTAGHAAGARWPMRPLRDLQRSPSRAS